MKPQPFLSISFLVLTLFSFAAAGKGRFDGLCPASHPELDKVAAKSEVTPRDLKNMMAHAENDVSQDEVHSMYTCLTISAPGQVDKLKTSKKLTEDEADKAKANLRKLAGFINNIPSGTRAESGINFNYSGLNSQGLIRHGETSGSSNFESRFEAVRDVGAGGN